MIPIPFCLGYAETHYSFLPGLSFIRRKTPEILIDAPARIEPGQDLPLALIVKDADRYPIVLEKIEVAVYQEKAGLVRKQIVFNSPLEISAPLFWKLLGLSVPYSPGSLIMLNARIEFKARGRQYMVLNHNFPTLAKGQLVVRVADAPLPCEPGWLYGDAHVHSNYSTSHVEFGAPLFLTAKMAKAFGLSWFTAADHSYDFMCQAEDYRQFASGLDLWEKRNREIAESSQDATILPAEEISCGNFKNQNVHLLAMGHRNFIPGSGDGARHKLNRNPEHTIRQAILRARGEGGLCFCAHPLARAGWFQNLALNRGSWSARDFNEDLHGIQLWNGQRDAAFYLARKIWVELLLAGRRLTLLAGSDAHGDFNCTRKVKTPFFSLDQDPAHFGMARTCVEAKSTAPADIMAALSHGRSIVTDGPFCRIMSEAGTLCWRSLSTAEFGRLWRLRVFTGRVGEQAERMEQETEWKDPQPCFDAQGRITLPKASYVRAELASRLGAREFLCMTNPVWLE